MKKTHILRALCAFISVIVFTQAHAQFAVEAILNPYNGLFGLSGDGSTILFEGGFWSAGTGYVQWNGPNNSAFSQLFGISYDGFLMGGQADSNITHNLESYFLDKNGDLTILPSPSDNPNSSVSCFGISGDGSTLLTNDYNSSTHNFSSRSFKPGVGYTTIVNGLDYTDPEACTYDGTLLAGSGFTSGGYNYVWIGGNTRHWAPFYGNFGVNCQVTSMSPDGEVVWGYIYTNATGVFTGFRYLVGSATLQLIPGFQPTTATDDNYVAIGTYNGQDALCFGASTVVNYQAWLASQGIPLPVSQLFRPFISRDGTHVVTLETGYGTNLGFYIGQPGFALVANNSTYNMTEGQTLSEPAAYGALAPTVNLYNGTAQLVSNPSDAAVFYLNSDGSFVYQPLPGFTGTDSFTFTVHRDLTTSNTATVFVNVAPAPVKICVKERFGLGNVPDGTVVKILNNDGTALSPPQSETTVSGVATFPPLPAPTAPNTTYEVEACVPSGGTGKPAIVHGSAGANQTIYLTPVRPIVLQTLTTGAPVAYSNVTLCGVSSSTGLDGQGKLVWLPDGNLTGSATMNPGLPATISAVLGASPSGVVAASGYAQVPVHLTRTTLTARTSTGTTYIPKAGTWSLTPGTLSEGVNGQVTSGAWWLPNGGYTAALSGATMNGSGSFTIGPPIADNWQVVVVVSGPKKP